MHALPTPGATITPTPRRRGWLGHAVRPIAVAAAVTAAIALTAVDRPAVARAWAERIDIAPGVSVNPAPGWVVGNQGPAWVSLHNGFSSAELEIKAKPARGTDPVAVLQADIGQLNNISTTGLTNVTNLSAPISRSVPGANFQQEASVSFTADGSSMMGAIPVTGSFIELLNPPTHQSAFIVFAQNADAPVHADNEAQMMIDSMQ
jgi:hypothetical protein